MKKYICYYCEYEYDLHKDVVDHLVENHVSVELKYRELELNVKTGRAGYRTKLYKNAIPHEFLLGHPRSQTPRLHVELHFHTI